MKRKILALCCAATLLVAMAGCGSASIESADQALREEAGYGQDVMDVAYDEEEPMEEEEEAVPQAELDAEAAPATSGGLGGQVPATTETESGEQDRKIIYSVDLSLQTTAFDDAVQEVSAITEASGGFIQHSDVEGADLNNKYFTRTAMFTARVPSDELDNFVNQLSSMFHMVRQQKSSSDITDTYYDTQARLNSLRVQEERLLAMLESADELQYLLEVERELADVLYQIESISSSLKRMESSVRYSTVTIHLREVSAYTADQPTAEPATFSERAQETLGDSWQGFLLFGQGILLGAIALVPFLPLLAIIGVVVFLLVRRARRRRTATRQPPLYPPQQNAPAPPADDTHEDTPKDE